MHACRLRPNLPSVRLQVWIAPGTGLATNFLEQLGKLSQDSTAVMMAIFAVFALVHSGLAYLRPYGEESHGGSCDCPEREHHALPCSVNIVMPSAHPARATQIALRPMPRQEGDCSSVQARS